MALFNLLHSTPKTVRDIGARLAHKEANRLEALKYGEAYFDGPREQGYGGYHYDGRWQAVARAAQQRYGLVSGQHVLDIGCAKGFFVHDLMAEIPGLTAYGVDISDYALSKAPDGLHTFLQQADARSLPFPDDSFDAVFAINSLHNLDEVGVATALSEINRVCRTPETCFVQVDAYRNEAERQAFEDWMLTARTYGTPAYWKSLFERSSYVGDYFWTIISFQQDADSDLEG